MLVSRDIKVTQMSHMSIYLQHNNQMTCHHPAEDTRAPQRCILPGLPSPAIQCSQVHREQLEISPCLCNMLVTDHHCHLLLQHPTAALSMKINTSFQLLHSLPPAQPGIAYCPCPQQHDNVSDRTTPAIRTTRQASKEGPKPPSGHHLNLPLGTGCPVRW